MRTFGSPRALAAASPVAAVSFVHVALALAATFSFTGLAPSIGCASVTSQFTVEKRPDGAYKLSCREALPRCLQRAEDICLGTRYLVIRAVDHHDYLGSQSSVGEVQQRSSEALFRCGKRGKSWWGPEADPMSMPDPVAATAATPTPPAAAARACVPGATQLCTGAAACRGGQSCLADGSGFAACDCGGAQSADGGTVSSSSAAPPANTGRAAAAPPPPSSSAPPAPSATPGVPVPRW